jgi:hypothetical protein
VGWERDLGLAAVQRRRAVGWQLGEELSNLGLVGGGRHALGPPAFVAEGCVDTADIACTPRVHPHTALVAADHLLAVVERDAAGTVHRSRAVHPVIGGVRGGDGRRRGRRRHEDNGSHPDTVIHFFRFKLADESKDGTYKTMSTLHMDKGLQLYAYTRST